MYLFLEGNPKKRMFFVLINIITAFSFSSFADNKDIEKYIKWKVAIQRPVDYEKVFSFFYNNPHWPLFNESVKIAEKNIDKNASNSIILKWFKRYPPKTSNGISLYIVNLLKNDFDFAKSYIKQTWIFQNLSPNFSKIFRIKFQKYITSVDDALRAKRLIKQNKIEQLKSMNHYVDIEIANYISKYLKRYFEVKPGAVSKEDLLDIDKRYNIIQRYIDKKQDKQAAEILILTNKDEDTSALRFFNQRRYIAFNILRSGNPELAYKVMKMHKLNSKSKDENLAKAEWFLGYVSFRFLKNPKVAKRHFEIAYNNSKNSIRLSKNAFWMAEVCRFQNDVLLALDWYKKASIHFATFYGYVAHERLIDMSKGLFSIVDDFYEAEEGILPAESEMIFYNRELVEVLLSIANFEKDKKYIKCFYKQLIEEIEDPNEEVLLMDITYSIDNVGLLISSASQKQHYFSNRKAYKTLENEDMKHILKVNNKPCFVSLVHSIIHRESAFNVNAKSHVGATGLMQIMPATAAYEAKSISFYVGHKSLFDKQKNITIGSCILNRLLKKYKNNLVYVMAAYNCGEGNVSKYQKSIKNLKNLTTIDLMELIPIKETRIYVKHVMRNLFTYQKIFKANECYDCNPISLIN